MDPSHAYFEVNKVKEYYHDNGTREVVNTPMSFQRCNINDFKYENKTQLENIRLDQYLCLKNDASFKVGGN